MLRSRDHLITPLDPRAPQELGSVSGEQTLIPFEVNPTFKHYASELLGLLGLTEFEEILQPIERARQACLSMGIPDSQHFKQIYRFSSLSMSLRCDYKLTPLATYLVTVNADPTNVNVAKAQLYFYLKNQSEAV